jgi:hypothetical protein
MATKESILFWNFATAELLVENDGAWDLPDEGMKTSLPLL